MLLKCPANPVAEYLATGFFIAWTQKKEGKMGSRMGEMHKDKGHIRFGTSDETPAGSNGESPSVLLDKIARAIRVTGGVADRLGNFLTYHAGSGRTRVEVKGIHTTTLDKQQVSNVVLIRSELSSYTIENRGMVLMNTMASLGAMVHEGNSERVSIVSRVSLFRGDHDSWRLYLPLITCSTMFHATGLLNAIGSAMGIRTARLNLSDDQGGPSRWSGHDFAFAAEKLEQLFGVLSTAGDDGLTAELPWEPGALSAMTGDVTSLLTFDASAMHPALGSGLFYKLELPLHFEEDELVFFANRLNEVEFESVDAPPFFGAWCSQLESGRLCHVGFWPNLLYQPGTVLNLAVWMFYRNRQAVAFISNNRIEPANLKADGTL